MISIHVNYVKNYKIASASPINNFLKIHYTEIIEIYKPCKI